MTQQNLKDLETIKDRYTYDAQSRQALEAIGKDRIKKYYLEVEEC